MKPRSLREWIGSTQNWVNSVWFQASAATQMRPPLFWDVTQCRLVIADVSGQSIGPIFKGQAVIALEDGADRFRETSVINYQSTMRNIPEEQRPQLGDQLKSTRFLITSFKLFPTSLFTRWSLRSWNQVLHPYKRDKILIVV